MSILDRGLVNTTINDSIKPLKRDFSFNLKRKQRNQRRLAAVEERPRLGSGIRFLVQGIITQKNLIPRRRIVQDSNQER